MIEEKKLTKDIFEINRLACQGLWNMESVTGGYKGSSSRLIFPKDKDDNIRISEQEARFLYCNILNDRDYNKDYYYSAETPTEEKYYAKEDQTKEDYLQNGVKGKAARSDLSLYYEDSGKFNKVMNIEFKGLNPPKEDIRNDMEKLIREKISGSWYCLLKNIDLGTLPNIFKKMNSSRKDCVKFLDKTEKLSIIFCFCVLEKGWACQKHFDYDPKDDFKTYVDEFFKLDYHIKSGKVCVDKKYGWEIICKDSASQNCVKPARSE